MDNKVVIITGSSSGIGEATAIRLSKLGCRLVTHGTDEERLKKVSDHCAAVSPHHYKPIEVLGDLTDIKLTPQRLITKTLEAYNQLDVLINNAGLYQPISVDDANAYEQFSLSMRLNVDAVVQLSLLAIPHLRKTNGNIVNVSSTLETECIHGGIGYSSAKAALTMFSKTLAVELGPTVRVNCVSPGPIATRMPLRCGVDIDQFKTTVGPSCITGRVGEPNEVARVIEFLASPESAFITGSDYIIDGGSTIKPRGKIMGQD